MGIWLNHFETHVIWREFQQFLKLYSHISVLFGFCRISVISEFSFLCIGLQTKNRISTKILIFQRFLLKLYQIHFCICLSLFCWQNSYFHCLTAFSVISVVSTISEFLTWPGQFVQLHSVQMSFKTASLFYFYWTVLFRLLTNLKIYTLIFFSFKKQLNLFLSAMCSNCSMYSI